MRKAAVITGFTIVFFMLASTAYALDSFYLHGDQHMDVQSCYYASGDLYDYSSVDILQNTHIVNLIANHYSNTKISGGFIDYLTVRNNTDTTISGGHVYVFNSTNNSSITITDGEVDFLWAYNNSCINVSGGQTASINVADTGRISVTDGYVGTLGIQGTSSAVISGGVFDMLMVDGFGKMTMTGGNAYVCVNGGSEILSIYGGTMEGLQVYGLSITALYGYDFQLGEGLSWDADGKSILGIGILSGKWYGQTETWSINIGERDPETKILAIVPEPATLLLLGLGGLMIKRKK